MKLIWTDDELTAYWAQQWVPPITIDIQPQYDGHKRLVASSWVKHIKNTAFPVFCYGDSPEALMPSPTNITQCFQQEYYLEALVLVIGWGAMARTKGRIYTHSLDTIEESLKNCAI